MQVGDIVARKSYNKDITFKIVDLQETEKGVVYTLEGINLGILANSIVEDFTQLSVLMSDGV